MQSVVSPSGARQRVDHLPVPAYVCDESGRIIAFNDLARQLLGVGPADEETDSGLWRRTRRNEARPAEPAQSAVARALRGERVLRVRGSLERPDGRRVAVLVSAERMVDERSGETTVLCVLQEESAAPGADDGESERMRRELSQLVYVASHDLQEPLRMVSGFLGLVQRRCTQLDARTQEYIGLAIDSSKRMHGMLDDLLGYSRAGRCLNPSPVDLDAVLAEALLGVAGRIAETGAEIANGPLPRLCIDRQQIALVLQHLIDNAMKFHGAEPPRVRIEGARDGSLWRFTVTDNGIGITPEHHERVFEVFQRLHTRREYPGNGIGLAICRKIIERHGGRIWIADSSETGTSVAFTLPA